MRRHHRPTMVRSHARQTVRMLFRLVNRRNTFPKPPRLEACKLSLDSEKPVPQALVDFGTCHPHYYYDALLSLLLALICISPRDYLLTKHHSSDQFFANPVRKGVPTPTPTNSDRVKWTYPAVQASSTYLRYSRPSSSSACLKLLDLSRKSFFTTPEPLYMTIFGVEERLLTNTRRTRYITCASM
ncbi:hypothetical protein BJY52DRAFT_464797 [Lactarius psammicola]|nr:hypothetical protein BJY52DRAFT_464797 [Lactarius psammicola]